MLLSILRRKCEENEHKKGKKFKVYGKMMTHVMSKPNVGT